MNYQQIVLHTTVEELDDLASALCLKGIEEIAINDPRDTISLMESKERDHWDYIDESVLKEMNSGPSITFYVEEDANTESILAGLPYRSVAISISSDEDWLHRWKDYFTPTKISDRFIVKPAWSTYEPDPGECVIDLDPGMAFGTGTHETTRLCLRLMEKYLHSGQRVLDVGTGTGILAIAAALLGCESVLAVDIDDAAVSIAHQNVQKNGVEHAVNVCTANLTQGVEWVADAVVSNLMADLIIRFAPQVERHIPSGGIYIAGGIIDGRLDDVCKALEGERFCTVETLRDGEWWSVAFKKL